MSDGDSVHSENGRDEIQKARPTQPVRKPTLKDVARAAGVHTGTASRALNPETRHLVNADTVRKVQRATEALGYLINPIARSLKTSRSMTIGMIIPDITNPIFPPMARGVEAVVEQAGYTALIVNSDGDLARERNRVNSLRARQVDGLIFATARRKHPLLSELHDARVPVVLIGRRTEGLDLPSVAPDDEAGVTTAVRHLVGLGHRDIACISGPMDTSQGVVRQRAFHGTMRELGVPTRDELTVEADAWTIEGGREAALELFGRHAGRFTAVVAGNDLVALGCMDVLAQRGLRCPDDVSVIGFNNTPMMERLSPPLTTIAVPHYDVGVEAARLLLEAIKDFDRTPRSLLLPVTLVERGSTARAPLLPHITHQDSFPASAKR